MSNLLNPNSPQQDAAASLGLTQSALSNQLYKTAGPELQGLVGANGSITNQLASTQGGQTKSSMDQAAYNSSLGQLNQSYDQAGFGNKEAVNYGALRAGERSGNVVGSALGSAATSLERDRQSALSNLQFQSSSASLTDYNQLLGLMGQGAKTSLGLAGGNWGLAAGGIGGLNPNSNLSQTMGVVSAVGSVLGGA